MELCQRSSISQESMLRDCFQVISGKEHEAMLGEGTPPFCANLRDLSENGELKR